MSCTIICLRPQLPAASSVPPEDATGSRMVLCLNLLRMGFTLPRIRYRTGGSLLHCLFTLAPPKSGAVILCCTFPGVASAGRYPASCPMKPGLSSPDQKISRDRTPCSAFKSFFHQTYSFHPNHLTSFEYFMQDKIYSVTKGGVCSAFSIRHFGNSFLSDSVMQSIKIFSVPK